MSENAEARGPACCANDWILPKEWAESVDRAIGLAAKERGKLPFPASQAAAILAGTKYAATNPFEATWRRDLLWDNGQTLKIGFSGGDSALAQRVFDTAIEWCDYANLKFVRGDFATADISVSFTGKGFQSELGRRSATAKPSMLLGFVESPQPDDHFRRLVLHEFGHALGLEHEHSHQRSGITWNESKLIAYLRGGLPAHLSDAEIMAQVKRIPGGPNWASTAYDLKSVMRYRFPESVFLTGWDPAFNTENTELSKGDQEAARLMYPGGTPPNELKKIQIGDTASGNIRQGEIHRYEFEAPAAGNYEITTTGPAVVRVELLTAAGHPPSSVTVNVSDALTPDSGARILAAITDGKYQIAVRPSPFDPARNEGDYKLTLAKLS